MNPYAPPAPPPQWNQPPPRPTTGVKVLAWFQIVLGSLGLFGAPCTLATRGLARDPVSRRLQEITYEGAIGAWTYSQLAIGTLLAIVLLASGIGLLGARPWARLTSLVYAGTSIALQVVGQVIVFTVLYPALDDLAHEYAGDPIAQAAITGGRIGGMFGAIFGMALPITMIIVLTRPGVKAQFVAA